MTRIGLYKYRWERHRDLIADLAVMTAGVFFAALIIFAGVKFSGGTEWIFGSGDAQIAGSAINSEAVQTAAEQTAVETIHGAAPVTGGQTASAGTLKISPAKAPNSPLATTSPLAATGQLAAKISIIKSSGYAYVGKNDVSLFRFEITSPVNASLKEIRFIVDGYASPADLSSLQLYYENKLAGQAPVLDATAVFNKIDIAFEPGQTASFEVKGNIGEEARAGDRVQVGIGDTAAIGLIDEDGAVLTTDSDYPLWGGLTSIIGNKIKK